MSLVEIFQYYFIDVEPEEQHTTLMFLSKLKTDAFISMNFKLRGMKDGEIVEEKKAIFVEKIVLNNLILLFKEGNKVLELNFELVSVTDALEEWTELTEEVKKANVVPLKTM